MALTKSQTCCTTTAPTIKVSVGPGSTDCIVSTPRDLTGNGLIVSQFIYIAKAGETTFSGTDSQGKELAAAPESSVVAVNGTVIPPSDYTLTPTVLTLSRETYLNDIVTVISFREPDSTGTADRLDDLEERVAALEGAIIP